MLGEKGVYEATFFHQEHTAMQEVNAATISLPVPAHDVLTSILRQGAQRLLTQAVFIHQPKCCDSQLGSRPKLAVSPEGWCMPRLAYSFAGLSR